MWGVEIKPGILRDIEEVSQEIVFEDIHNQIIEEIRDAKYLIWISVAWFTDPVLYKEYISIDKNHATAATFADEFMKLKSKKVWMNF